jgi:hypothetical protein
MDRDNTTRTGARAPGVERLVRSHGGASSTTEPRLHDHRADDEARTLIHSALANAGDLAVTDTELRVTFAPLSSPHRTAALAALCAELDALAPRCPGTHLRVRYAVAA